MRLFKPHEGDIVIDLQAEGDIVINLQDTSGVTGMVHASVTDDVINVWRYNFGHLVTGFRQKDSCRTSVDYEVVFVTPLLVVNFTKLEEELKRIAQTVIATHFTRSARCL